MKLPPPPDGYSSGSTSTLPPPPQGYTPVKQDSPAYTPPADDTEAAELQSMMKSMQETEASPTTMPDMGEIRPVDPKAPAELPDQPQAMDVARLGKRLAASAANYAVQGVRSMGSGMAAGFQAEMGQPGSYKGPTPSETMADLSERAKQPVVDMGPPEGFWDKVADSAGALVPMLVEYSAMNALVPGSGLIKGLKTGGKLAKAAAAGLGTARSAGMFAGQTAIREGDDPKALGHSAGLGGVFGAIEAIPGASVPAKLAKTVLESVALERATAMQGGDENDRMIAFLTPWGLKASAKATKALGQLIVPENQAKLGASRKDFQEIGIERTTAEQRQEISQAVELAKQAADPQSDLSVKVEEVVKPRVRMEVDPQGQAILAPATDPPPQPTPRARAKELGIKVAGLSDDAVLKRLAEAEAKMTPAEPPTLLSPEGEPMKGPVKKAEDGPLPQWAKDQIEADYALAERLGIVDAIAKLSSQGKAAREIVSELNVPGQDTMERNRIVRSVRSRLDIPSMDQATEFAAWKAEYDKAAQASPDAIPAPPRPSETSLPPETPPVAPEAKSGVSEPVVDRPPGATSARKAWMTEDAENLFGLKELPPAERVTFQETLDAAKARYVPERSTWLATEVLRKPRAFNGVETAEVVLRAAELKLAHAEAMKQVKNAQGADIQAASAEAGRIEQEFDIVRQALKASGTEKGRDLVTQKLTIDEDMNLLSVLTRAKAAKGEEIAPKEREFFERKISELEKINEQLNKRLSEGPAAKKPAPDPEWLTNLSKKAVDARARLTQKLSGATLRSGIDPTILSDLAIIGAEKIARGVKNASDFAKEMAADLKDDWDRFKANTAEIYKASQDAYGVESKPAAKTPQERGEAALKSVEKAIVDYVQRITAGDTKQKVGRKRPENALLKELQVLRQGLAKTLQDMRAVEKTRQKVEELTKHLEAGTLPDAKPHKVGKQSAELKQQREALKQARKELAASEPAVKKRLEKQIDTLEKRLSGKMELVQKKEARKYSAEIEKLEFQRDKLRGEVKRRIQDMKPKTVWQHIAEPLNLARAIMTVDGPPVFRQGGFVIFGSPKLGAKSIWPALKAFASEKAAYRTMREIEARPNAQQYARYKMLSDYTGPLAAQEENFMSRLLQKAQSSKAGRVATFPVQAAARTYTVFLNKLRADKYDTMVATLAKNGEATAVEQKAIANYINAATGRGNLGSIEPHAALLNTIFFSPRYVLSRFQLLAGQPLYRGSGRTRMLIAKEYGKYLMGIGAVYTLARMAGAEIETDWRSADFGKIRIGQTRLDFLSGFAQTLRFVGQLVTGEKKTAKGEVKSLRGGKQEFGADDMGDTIMRFVRSKLSPIIGSGMNFATGENVVGDKVTIGSEARNLLTPIFTQDLYGTLDKQGLPAGTILNLMSLFGMGLQTYDNSKKTKK